MTCVLLDEIFKWAEIEAKNPGRIPSLGVNLTKYVLTHVPPKLGEPPATEVVVGTGVGTLSFHPQQVVPLEEKPPPASFVGPMTYTERAGGIGALTVTEVLTVQISLSVPPHPPVILPEPFDSYTVTFVPEPKQPNFLDGSYLLACSPPEPSGPPMSLYSGLVTAAGGVVMHLQAELCLPPQPLPPVNRPLTPDGRP